MKLYLNAMEEMVEQEFDKLSQKEGWCTCDICRNDIVAIALNNLPPHYVVTHEGELFTKLEALKAQCRVDITSALIRAGDIVKQYSRH